jgi:GTP:adenosylcobinamide-phosphate guanylyltransferase/tRNA A-37 threonylcarbamoyl transferase component Bud32
MTVDHIIIQAGGRGSRMGRLARNKPKGIVPYGNLPVMFHLFRQFPRKNFIIIGDYLHSVLENYLEAFAEVRYVTVRAQGSGTCAGLKAACALIPENAAFMLIWSDIILSPRIEIDGLSAGDYLGVAGDFECRWSYKEGVLRESPSKEHGVAGMFIFQDKTRLTGAGESGEFVRFLAKSGMPLTPFNLAGSREIGTPAAAGTGTAGGGGLRCRAFNRMVTDADTVTKIPVDEQGEKLRLRELAWYREAGIYHFDMMPKIISFEPFVMRRINGCNIFNAVLDDEKKKTVIDTVVSSLKKLHAYKYVERDVYSIKEAYYTKTMRRLEKVRALIPFAGEKEIIINGINCRNIFFYREEFRALVEDLLYDAKFAFVHGDCTFSNMMINDSLDITFLDPRGYFGFTELYGDTAYDWAKVYYSINGDYDQFNNGNFTLEINDNSVKLEIKTNGWKHLSGYYLEKTGECPAEKIRFIHAIIWLSLTTYAWEDYDSICGAFYNGLLLMNRFLMERK